MHLPPLVLPMMMYGKYLAYVKETDPVTKKQKTVYEVNAKGKRKAKKKWIIHDEEKGDPGFFPSVNHIYKPKGRGGKQLTEAAEELLNKWYALSRMWAEEHGWEKTKKEKVILEIYTYFPNDNVKRDAHNVVKLMMDALEESIYDNDCYALPRIMDFDKVKEGEKPHFKIFIRKKAWEDEEMLQTQMEIAKQTNS